MRLTVSQKKLLETFSPFLSFNNVTNMLLSNLFVEFEFVSFEIVQAQMVSC